MMYDYLFPANELYNTCIELDWQGVACYLTTKDAQGAWQQFQDLGAEVSSENRERLLRSLEREKQAARARRLQARGSAHD